MRSCFTRARRAPTAATMVERMAAHDMRVGALGARRMRIVTHLDVDRDQAQEMLTAFSQFLNG